MTVKSSYGHFVVVIFLLLVFILAFYFSDRTITGSMLADFERSPVDVFVDESESFVLSLSNSAPVALNSLGVSGEVFGAGRVRIFIDNGLGVRRLVFSNVPETNTVLSTDSDFVRLKDDAVGFSLSKYRVLTPVFYDAQESESLSGSFRRACAETCEFESGLFNSARYELLVYVDAGTSVRLNEILYKLNK